MKDLLNLLKPPPKKNMLLVNQVLKMIKLN